MFVTIRFVPQICMLLLCAVVCGCGTTRENQATHQLVLSNAVDRSISALDFRPLSGRKVYLDTSYLRHVKGEGFVNSEYVTSGVRQQIVAAGCLIQDSNQDADIVIEARIGVLGADDHQVTFGIPENNALSSAVALIPNSPRIPVVPEIALAKRDAREGAAKIAAFAYDRVTREPVWQSGLSESMATARNTWVFGVGPFQGGTIREETKLAGSQLIKFRHRSDTGSPSHFYDRPPVDYTAETRFQSGWPIFDHGGFSADMLETTDEDAPSNEESDSIAETPEETLQR